MDNKPDKNLDLDALLRTTDAPAPDDNARKTALNLALTAFDEAQKESVNTSQGFSLLARLTGKSGQHRRIQMKTNSKNMKLVYGGMATAMVVILAVGVSLPQTREAMHPTPQGGNNFSTISASIVAGKADSKVANALPAAPAVAEAPAQAQSDARAVTAPAATAKPEAAGLSQIQLNVNSNAPAQADAAMAPPPVAEDKMVNTAMPVARAKMSVAGGALMEREQFMPEPVPQPAYQDVGRDKFEHVADNPVKAVAQEPVSTFSIDVDTSSYSFVRRQLNAGTLPQKDAVRVEEMVNYFDYHYPLPETKDQPFKPTVTVTPSPWIPGHKLVHIGIKGYDIASDDKTTDGPVRSSKPHSNLVFLIDTSGSMESPDKLPLLVNSLKLLLDSLKPDDTVGIVTYAGNAGVALEPTKVSDKAKILASLDGLSAGGSTAGAEGIRTAYQLAESHFDKASVNRVILATDGDFNVGITNPKELTDFIERERKTGIFLSVLGFGEGNYNDQMMQTLAQNGNGNAAYIDTLNEARKVLVQESSSTLFPIAKDVKIQVEFNPATVAEYRLVGYETRALKTQDFNNDAVDAGDIGSGHAVTAIYDITPVGTPKSVDDSRYAKPAASPAAEAHKADANFSNEYAFLKIRYKLPDQDTSKLITTPISGADEKPSINTKCPPNIGCVVSGDFGASDDVRFSVAVAGFAQLLKGGQYTGNLSYDNVINEAQAAKGTDEYGYRAEFIQLVRLAKTASALPKTQE